MDNLWDHQNYSSGWMSNRKISEILQKFKAKYLKAALKAKCIHYHQSSQDKDS